MKIDINWVKLTENDRKSDEMGGKSTRILGKIHRNRRKLLWRFCMEGGVKKLPGENGPNTKFRR